ncbi:MAG: D-alanyl-D-alanine carboxypeptidase/D-alanyl-D-alanine-endopeptidase [Chloroflexi bacterium]|nr:D-alanyl-D-alanine carboxypeptidase/D-alanyl-D-alanine-endopeptidase [Chloroflexota bacterium]
MTARHNRLARWTVPVALASTIAAVTEFPAGSTGRPEAAAETIVGREDSGPAASLTQAAQARSADAGDEALRRILRRTLRRAGPATGAWVYDASDKRVLFALRETQRRSLASNTKLFTGATALRRLGAQRKLVTEVVGDGLLRADGTFDGHLYLRGAGDPTLDRRALKRLARQLREDRGIERVTGRVIGDESAFDARRGTASTDGATSMEIGAPLSALALADTETEQPATLAARRLDDALEERGVRIRSSPQEGTAPEGAKRLAAVRSPTVAKLVHAMLKDSINLHSEMLAKAIARERGATGTTRLGIRTITRYAQRLGARPRLADASGLSLSSRASPRSVGRLLDAVRGLPEFGAFRASLPIAGQDGTLRDRMRRGPAHGRCQAKTGTRSSVSALSGYCRARSGRTIVFSLILNRIDPLQGKRLEDVIVQAIARHG